VIPSSSTRVTATARQKLRTVAITAAGAVVASAAIAAYISSLLLLQPPPTDNHPFSFSSSFYFSSLFTSFWLLAWLLDARFTAKHWKQYVMKGYETNIVVNAVARWLTRGRAWPTLVIHAVFIVSLACIIAAFVVFMSPLQLLRATVPAPVPVPIPMQVPVSAVSVTVIASSFLAFFGAGNLDAYIRSREFVRHMQCVAVADTAGPGRDGTDEGEGEGGDTP
jgi:hypothetical protein